MWQASDGQWVFVFFPGFSEPLPFNIAIAALLIVQLVWKLTKQYCTQMEIERKTHSRSNHSLRMFDLKQNQACVLLLLTKTRR